jgi:hypothetical protein
MVAPFNPFNAKIINSYGVLFSVQISVEKIKLPYVKLL